MPQGTEDEEKKKKEKKLNNLINYLLETGNLAQAQTNQQNTLW